MSARVKRQSRFVPLWEVPSGTTVKLAKLYRFTFVTTDQWVDGKNRVVRGVEHPEFTEQWLGSYMVEVVK